MGTARPLSPSADIGPPVTALSPDGLRRRIEATLLPDVVDVRLMLDRAARRERDQRRQQAQLAR